MLVSLDSVGRISKAESLAHMLVSVANESNGASFDSLVAFMGGYEDDTVFDSASPESIAESSVVFATFLDALEVDPRVINDAMSSNDDISQSAVQSIAVAFDSAFGADGIGDAIAFYAKSDFDSAFIEDEEATFDSMVKPKSKSGYRPKVVVRNGKRTWVNKRASGKKVVLSSAQRRGLMKARLKANSASATRKRVRSSKLGRR